MADSDTNGTDPPEAPPDAGRRSDSARGRAAAAVGRAKQSDRMRAAQRRAGDAVQRARESEGVQSARQRAGDAVQRARESEGVQSARQRAGDAVQRARESEGVQAARQRAGDALQRARESDSATRARAAASEAAGRVRQGELGDVMRTGATNAMAAGHRALDGRDGRPRIPVAVWLVLGLATEATTFLNWLSVDVSRSAARIDAPIPVSLLGALDRGYSIHEVAGLGFALTAVTVTALVLGGLGYCFRRWYCWLLAGAVQLVGVVVAAVALVVAGIARSATGWVIPADWEPYAPQVTPGPASYGYLLAASAFVAASVWVALGSRRRGRREQQADDVRGLRPRA